MNLNDPGVDTVIAQLAVNDKAADESEGLITDIVAFFEPEQAMPSQNEPDRGAELRFDNQHRVIRRMSHSEQLLRYFVPL